MNLRHLEFMHSRVRKVPRLLGKLKKLQTLTSFYVGQGSEFGIQQLAQLNLRGRLSIEELQNIVSPLDAYAANLKNKTHLVELDLKWTLDRNIDDSMKEREILENLQPSKHLQKLSIENYGGTQFPSWLFNGSLTKVVSITLEECKHCVSLPPLGLLPFLKELSISRLDGIVSINADFCGSSSSSFTSLETLSIYDMKEWEEWECKGVIGAFPRLQRLYISNCPKFKRQLPEQLCHLNFLTIRECKQLEDSTLRALEIRELDLGDSGKLQIHLGTTLERLTITGHNMEASLLRSNGSKNGCYDFLVMLQIHSGCDSLTTFPLDFFPKLCRLELRCGNLQMISQGHIHNHLEYLNILDCPQFESFPSEGLRAPFLEDFSITRLVNLKSLPKRMQVLLPSLTHLKIKDCPQVELFSDGGLPSNLESIDLINCSKLVASLKGTLRANPYLTFMLIGKLDVESFPDEDFLPLSLNFLTIFDCPNLKELEYKGLCHLSSLSTLDLRDCPSLHCLPEEGLPKSTAFFLIWGNCPLLKEHCQKLACQDWIEIADGRYIRVPIL